MTDYTQTFEAIQYVQVLEALNIQDDVPCMQAANSALKYEVNYDTNNEDSRGFRLVQANFKEEASTLGEFNNLLKTGQEYVITLYTWRSCSRALPTVSGHNTELSTNIQEKTLEILRPSIEKLKEFRKFQNKALQRLCDEISKLTQRRKRDEYVSEAYMLATCNMLKMFALIDEMKNIKASMKNDNTQYKRAAQYLKRSNADDIEYATYLAQRNVLRTELKEALLKIDKYEEFFCDLVNFCVNMYTEKLYIFPEEKHTFVLVIAFSLYLMDTKSMKDNKVININKIKTLSLSKIDQIFKECEVVNVFGDMSIIPFSFVQSTPNFDPNKWPECMGTKISSQGSLLNHIVQFRSEYTALTSELARYSNAFILRPSDDIKENLKPAYDLALKSLQLLSKWTTQIIDTFSWKLGHLADPSTDSSIPADAEDYEKATRYNYTSDEKFALIEVIAMIKTIQQQLTRFDNHFTDTTIPHMYAELQRFLHLTLPDIFNKSGKKLSAKSSFCLKTIWAVGLDMNAFRSETKVLDMLKKLSGKKHATELEGFLEKCRQDLIARKVPPGSTQLYLIRCIIESLINERNKNTMKKEFDRDAIFALVEFHKKSYYWSYMLNYSDTLDICCDLSQLWYREFFLEMTNGKRIQFPIETSIPCILTNHILDTQHPAYIEYLLYPLDLYNDSAICALKKFKRQFLYNEIEAEVNFMMIQLIVRLSEQIYVYYKQCASVQLINKRFRNQMKFQLKKDINGPVPGRYVTLMKQRHLLLLGQSFNFSKLISQNINKSIYASLETAVKRFKKTGITNVIEFHYLLEVNKVCHRLLSEHLDLDDFDSMLTEITQSTTSKFGNVTSFIISEITDVICNNYAFNGQTEKFITIEVIAKKPLGPELQSADRAEHLWGSRTLNGYFDTIFKLYHGYFGKEHLITIYKLIGYDGVYELITKLDELANNTIKNEIHHYLNCLLDLMPVNLARLDEQNYVEQIKIILEDLARLLALNNINTEVAKAFKKLGNYIIIVLNLENSMFVQEGIEMKQTFPFIEQFPKVAGASKMTPEQLELETEKLRSKYQVYNIKRMMDRFGTREQYEISQQQLSLTKERLSQEFTIFKKFLYNIQACLLGIKATDDFGNPINFWTQRSDNQMDYKELNFEKTFYMVWSAIIFIFSTPKPKELRFDAVHGESLYWAGTTIMALMNQHKLFEHHNICGKLYRSYSFAKKDNKSDANLELTVSRIYSILQIHTRIFDIINRYLCINDTYTYVKPAIIHLDPDSESDDESDDDFD